MNESETKSCKDDIESADLSNRLAYAVQRKDPVACRKLLAAGADPNSDAIEVAHVVLTHAIQTAFDEGVTLLLNAGANVNAVSECLAVPLCVAAIYRDVGICRDLITRGADVTARDSQSRTALHWAAGAASIELCEALIAAGADVNAVDENHRTPLHDAVLTRKSHTSELCDLLLTAGASSSYVPPAPDPKYLTAFQLAASYGRLRSVSYLLEACHEDPSQLTLAGDPVAAIAAGERVPILLRSVAAEQAVARALGSVQDAGATVTSSRQEPSPL